jgi:hypothetical protein
VFNALVGSRLSLLNVLRLLLASLAVNLAVLASLGPIVVFFSLTTTSYAFVKLLNVAVFTVAGVLGLIFLRQTLHRLTTIGDGGRPAPSKNTEGEPADAPAPDEAQSVPTLESPSPLEMPSGETLGRHTRSVFACWMVLFAVVGAQMGWVLRPFIGDPNREFTWFRERKSNFFEAVIHALEGLFNSGGA